MFGRHVLDLDPAAEVDRIAGRIREQVGGMKKRGAVVAISGGIDSSVVAGLCARALGGERVFGLLLPERDSSGESSRLGSAVAETFGIPFVTENIAPALEAAGCYARQLEAIRQAVLDVHDVTHVPAVARELALIRVKCAEGERSAVNDLISIFRARIVDVAADSVIVEISGDPEKVDGLVELLRPRGIVEMVRTGKVAMTRGASAKRAYADAHDTDADPLELAS